MRSLPTRLWPNIRTARFRAATVTKRYQSGPNSGRDRPKTSAAMAYSKMLSSSNTMVATSGPVGAVGMFGMILTMIGTSATRGKRFSDAG